HSRNRARPGAAQERQCPPEVEALAQLVAGFRLDDLGAVVEDVVEKILPRAAQGVRQFLRRAAREDVALVPLGDVGASPLDKVVREALAETFPLGAHEVCEALEVRGEEAEQPVEGGVVSAVRGRREEDEVTKRTLCQALEQLVPLVAPLA